MKHIPGAVRALIALIFTTLAGILVGVLVGHLSGAVIGHPTMFPFVSWGAIMGLVFSVAIIGVALID